MHYTTIILEFITTMKTLYPCLGAIVGDTVGSVYEYKNIDHTHFALFSSKSNYTDDSIMTIAVADWLVSTDRSPKALEEKLVLWASKYPRPKGGYGGMFRAWLFGPGNEERHPYNSWGNGSAMRASACGWVAHSLEEALDLGKRSAEITHNHPEGIKGAQAVAAAIFLARQGETKEAIRDYIEQQFGYDLHTTCDAIRPTYGWEASCQGTVPPAFVAWLDSTDFESAVRLAVSLGGDSDTLACITGSIAQAFYNDIPDPIIQEMRTILPEEFWDVMNRLSDCID